MRSCLKRIGKLKEVGLIRTNRGFKTKETYIFQQKHLHKLIFRVNCNEIEIERTNKGSEVHLNKLSIG